MYVLVACEESQVVTKAFRDRGHEAFSCDLIETSGARRDWHLQGDARLFLDDEWDLIIAFPPCTYFSNAGMCNKTRKGADDAYRALRKWRTDEAFKFVMTISNAPAPRIAIENPVGYLSTHWRKPDQIILPWQFGHSVNKKTCLWLKGLPKLVPTNVVERDNETAYLGKRVSSWYAETLKAGNGDLKLVSKIRSTTFQGIADAMAEQWGNAVLQPNI